MENSPADRRIKGQITYRRALSRKLVFYDLALKSSETTGDAVELILKDGAHLKGAEVKDIRHVLKLGDHISADVKADPNQGAGQTASQPCKQWVNSGACPKGAACQYCHPYGDELISLRRQWVSERQQHRQKLAHNEGNPHVHDAASRHQRAAIFSRWLLDTFGRELLEQGPVLDIAGGPRGELAFELEQLGIRSVTVDPRPQKLSKKQLKRLKGPRQSGDKPSPFLASSSAEGPFMPLPEATQLAHAAYVTSNGSPVHSMEGQEATEPAQQHRPDQYQAQPLPHHECTSNLPQATTSRMPVHAVGLAAAALSGQPTLQHGPTSPCWYAAFNEQAPAAAQRDDVAHNASPDCRAAAAGPSCIMTAQHPVRHLPTQHHLRDMPAAFAECGRPMTSKLHGTATADAAAKQDSGTVNDLVSMVSTLGAAASSKAAEWKGQAHAGDTASLGRQLHGMGQPTDLQYDDRQPAPKECNSRHIHQHLQASFDSTFWRQDSPHHALVKASSLVIGLHPDEATEAVVDCALANDKPFAVVPCCVFPRLFPERQLMAEDGTLHPVVLHGELVHYLQAKANGKTDYLKFQGRNLAVYGRAADRLSMPC
ncbi:hypothetical protein WJX74_001270 [Apatococcus lobatus]|uniref:C3H1-type domain-containing protein n=1 Tax=Apatococcus lobatus TaxID=904363 RepID=A0AAW1RT45_9CHLO